MKHILIPTDFTLGSLAPVQAALAHYPDCRLRITLMNLMEPPTDIMDGLRLSFRNAAEFTIPVEFTAAMQELETAHPERIESVRAGTWFGNTSAYVSNVLSALRVDAVFADSAFRFKPASKKAVNPMQLLRKSAALFVDASEVKPRQTETVYATPAFDRLAGA